MFKKVLFLTLIFCYLILWPVQVWAVDFATTTPTTTLVAVEPEFLPWAATETKISLSKDDLTKDVKVEAENKNFRLEVYANQINQAADFVLRQLNEQWVPTSSTVDLLGKKNNLSRVSVAWEFDVLTKKKFVFNKTFDVVLQKPTIFDEAGNTDMRRMRIHFWDKGKKVWRPLPTVLDIENNELRAEIKLPYAILAAFMVPDEFEAWASWYGDALTPSSPYNCASNNYKIGSYVKVCRLDNLQKCVKVKVVSTGPYVDNRIVDLTKTAFKKIGNPGGGVVGVRVVGVK